MVTEDRVTSPLTQVVAVGEIPVEVDVERETARMRQLSPSFGAEFTDRELLAGAVGLSVVMRAATPRQKAETIEGTQPTRP